MKITARFYVESVTHLGRPGFRGTPPETTAERVVMKAVTSGGPDDPNRSYSEATPTASVEMYISNKDAWGSFKPGHSYDVMFTPTPKES